MRASLNKLDIADYLKSFKLIIISLSNSSKVTLEEVRPIQVLPHLIKILEKAIKIKLSKLDSKLLQTGSY